MNTDTCTEPPPAQVVGALSPEVKGLSSPVWKCLQCVWGMSGEAAKDDIFRWSSGVEMTIRF